MIIDNKYKFDDVIYDGSEVIKVATISADKYGNVIYQGEDNTLVYEDDVYCCGVVEYLEELVKEGYHYAGRDESGGIVFSEKELVRSYGDFEWCSGAKVLYHTGDLIDLPIFNCLVAENDEMTNIEKIIEYFKANSLDKVVFVWYNIHRK